MRKIFPHPALSVLIGLIWLLLVNQVTVGSLILALAFGIIIPWVSAPYWPGRPRIARPMALLEYIGIVVYDVIVSSFAVAKVILFMRPDQIKTTYIVVPIDLPSPEAITLLAGTITMTPGTLTADMSTDGTVLLIHSLHAPDPEAVRAEIKSRYEARLKRIFA